MKCTHTLVILPRHTVSFLIWDALRDLVPFVTFKNVKNTLKVTLLHGCFSPSLNCTNGTKSGKTSYNKAHPLLMFKKNCIITQKHCHFKASYKYHGISYLDRKIKWNPLQIKQKFMHLYSLSKFGLFLKFGSFAVI